MPGPVQTVVPSGVGGSSLSTGLPPRVPSSGSASLLHRLDPHHYAATATPSVSPAAAHSPEPSGDDDHDLDLDTADEHDDDEDDQSGTVTPVPASSSSALVAVPAKAAPPATAALLSVTQRALHEAGSGLGGAIFSACCVYPLDLVKTRLQLPNCPYDSLFGGVAQIVREEGLLTLYTGLSSELLKTSVQNFSYFYWYIVFKEWIQARLAASSRTPLAALPPQNALGFGTHHELAQHQALCTDEACFCRSSNHLAAHSEAHKQRAGQVDQWRRRAESLRRRQSAARRAAQTAEEFDCNAFHPRLMASVSEPHLASLGGYDIDDAPYVDVKSQDQTTLVTNTATVLPVDTPTPSTAASSAAPSPSPPSPLEPSPAVLSIGASLLIGTLAGCVTQLVVNPISVIQTRMMTQKRGGGSAGFWAIASSILKDEGASAFFAGILPGFILSTNPSIQFMVFDRLKALILRILSQSMQARSLSILESFVLGAFSKIVATLVTYPYIFARVRLMVKHDASGAPATVYKGTLDVIFRTLKYEGIQGLFTGLQAQLLKSVLGSALMFMAKEKLVVIIAYFVKAFQRVIEKHRAAQQQKAAPPAAASTTAAAATPKQ